MKKAILLFASCVIGWSLAAQVVDAEPEKQFKCDKSEINYIAVDPTGSKLVVGLSEGAQVFDMNSGKKLYDLEFEDNRHDEAVFYLTFDEEGQYCAGVGRYGHRVVWDLSSGEEVEASNSMHWLPTSQDTKIMGLSTKNSEDDYPYLQTTATVPGNDDITATAKGAKIEFYSDSEEAVVQTISWDKAKNSSHKPPVFFDGEYLVTGTDTGTIDFYKLQ